MNSRFARMAMTGVAALLATALMGAARAADLRASQGERRWLAFDGRDWSQFAPKEKRAYVAGFLAGAAGAGTSATADTAVIRRTVDSLYRAGGLRFPFGHMVYATQLDEFYWWDNHVPVPLYLALWSINERLQKQDE